MNDRLFGTHVPAIAPAVFESTIARNAVVRSAPPADASEDVVAILAAPADNSRTEFPRPERVAAACCAALIDEAPLTRNLVAPNAEEAGRTPMRAAHEWGRLNASTPHRWST